MTNSLKLFFFYFKIYGFYLLFLYKIFYFKNSIAIQTLSKSGGCIDDCSKISQMFHGKEITIEENEHPIFIQIVELLSMQHSVFNNGLIAFKTKKKN